MDEKKLAAIGAFVATATEVLFSEKGKKFICGTYSDGTARSITDAINGEIISPKEKEKRKSIKKIKNKSKKKKKNKKKKSKNKNKKNKSNDNIYWL